MNFELDEQQQMLQTTARNFLAAECDKSVVRQIEASDTGHSPQLWRQMAALGWTGIIVPEQYGGVGLGLLDLAVLFEEIGRAAYDSPLFGTVMATLALVAGGTKAQQQSLLPQVATGELILTLAIAEREVSHDLRFVSVSAQPGGDGYVLRGTKLFVPYATVAGEILVVARTAGAAGDEAGLSLFMVNAKAAGVRCRPLKTIAPDKQFQVDLEGVPVAVDRIVGPLNDGFALLQPVLAQAAAVQCAEMVGNAQHELDITAQYTKERVQFARPLGSFQAVQHHLANMFTDVQGARWSSYQAIARLSRGLSAARELAVAMAFTCDACQRVSFLAQQLHGGVGVDMAYDLQFYYRRAKALELRFGASPVHLQALERHVGL
ncbi:MAG: acyl-CoA/acyl-ACP dehydrogenase [Deltaproteobacteria bacterium]|nr:acyl-CoA/acyl-ACP dehydrogenase [Deltaproteobacteria bacterium]